MRAVLTAALLFCAACDDADGPPLPVADLGAPLDQAAHAIDLATADAQEPANDLGVADFSVEDEGDEIVVGTPYDQSGDAPEGEPSAGQDGGLLRVDLF